MDSTDVNLSSKINVQPKRERKKKERAPFAQDRRSTISVVSKRGMQQQEGCCECPDRVGRRGGRESTEDGRESYEREENEDGCLDCERA